MTAVRPVIMAAVRRRRLQSVVVAIVALLSTATVVLAVGLLVLSDAPFDHAFSRQSGAHATATLDPSRTSPQALRATGTRPGVTAAAGPFDAASAQLTSGPLQLGTLTVQGRANPAGPVDILNIRDGGWLTGPGQIVLSGTDIAAPGTSVGGTITLGGVNLRVVGHADSVTGTAQGWVWPTQNDVLHATDATPTQVMLYRFSSAGDDAAVAASLSAALAGVPRQAVLGSSSYLSAKRSADSSTAPVVPFVVAFAAMGLAMSTLIVANVVNGAVVSGFRTIGVLKSLGFTPAQVVGVYAGQMAVPGIAGCVVGAGVGNLLALPLLTQTGRAYNVATTTGVAGWVDLLGVLSMSAVVAVAATAPAVTAGRFSAVQTISLGRAPHTGRGYRARRALAATPLPLPARFGLGTPFARPARTAVTALAVVLGAATIVFSVGLSTSLRRVAEAATQITAVPVEVDVAGGGQGGGASKGAASISPGGATADTSGSPTAIRAAIARAPGTARVVGLVDVTDVSLTGSTGAVTVEAYDGDPSWVGFPLISGHWFTSPDEVVAASGLLRSTGHHVGDTITLTAGHTQRRVRIVGEVFDLNWNGSLVLAATSAVTGLAPSTAPTRFDVALTAGTSPDGYVAALSTTLGTGAYVSVRQEQNAATTFAILIGLVGTLTLLLSAVAALGVFNTALLNTRERIHEIGVLKTLGMTPRQIRWLVTSSMAAIGFPAGLLAVPLGVVLQHRVLPVMADAAGTAIPTSFVDVYGAVELTLLACSGILLAVLGAAIPATWAANTRIATALRAE